MYRLSIPHLPLHPSRSKLRGIGPTANKQTIGIDLGDRRHTVCVLSARGDSVDELALTNTRENLLAFARRHPGATIILETGTHSPWVFRLLEALGHTVCSPSDPLSLNR